MLKMCRDLGFEVAANPEDLSLRKVRLTLPLKSPAVRKNAHDLVTLR